MQTKENNTGYFKRLLSALLNQDEAEYRGQKAAPLEIEHSEAPASEQEARLRAEIASLQLDQTDRDKRIESMRADYESLLAEKRRVEKSTGQRVLLDLFGKVAPTLSNMSAVATWFQQGKEVQVGDLIRLNKELEKKLGQFGLQRIGEVGEKVSFEPARHQRMSGGSVRDGIEVTVQMPGYHIKEQVVLKAMVSARED